MRLATKDHVAKPRRFLDDHLGDRCTVGAPQPEASGGPQSLRDGETGGFGSNGSGDYAIAFSTHEGLRIRRLEQPPVIERPILDNEAMTGLFLAAAEATEEAILDSLFTATTTESFRGSVPALPVERVLELAGNSALQGALKLEATAVEQDP